MPEFHAETPQAAVSKGLSQDPYVAARAGVEPTILRLKVIDSTNAPPRPIRLYLELFGSPFGVYTYSSTQFMCASLM